MKFIPSISLQLLTLGKQKMCETIFIKKFSTLILYIVMFVINFIVCEIFGKKLLKKLIFHLEPDGGKLCDFYHFLWGD